jgi:hypothetical protein
MTRHVASKEDEDILGMEGVFGYLISSERKKRKLWTITERRLLCFLSIFKHRNSCYPQLRYARPTLNERIYAC